MPVFLPLVLALLSPVEASESLAKSKPEAHVVEDRHTGIELTDFFSTSYDMEYGYQLWRPNNLETPIPVRFSNTEVESEFGQFESNTQLGLYVGKKTYCECTGEFHFENGVMLFFKVRKARLFAQ